MLEETLISEEDQLKILLTQSEFSCDLEKVSSEKEKILTLVNNFSYEIPTILNEKEFLDPMKIKSLMPYPGILLSSSGSGGEKKWILQSWNNLKERIKNKKSPTQRCLIFLSIEHAAGIEGFFLIISMELIVEYFLLHYPLLKF